MSIATRFSHVCLLCGARAPSSELLDAHLSETHDSSLDEARRMAPNSMGTQLPPELR